MASDCAVQKIRNPEESEYKRVRNLEVVGAGEDLGRPLVRTGVTRPCTLEQEHFVGLKVRRCKDSPRVMKSSQSSNGKGCVAGDLPVQRKNTSEKSEGGECKTLEARISEVPSDR